MIYECLNSFYLEPGEHDLTIEFATSPLRTVASVISLAASLLVCCAGILLVLRRWRQKRPAFFVHFGLLG
jgi:hypothetical protein